MSNPGVNFKNGVAFGVDLRPQAGAHEIGAGLHVMRDVSRYLQDEESIQVPMRRHSQPLNRDSLSV